MGAVSSLVTGAYGTMCKCFSIGLLLSRSLFCRVFQRFCVKLYNKLLLSDKNIAKA